MKIVFNVFNPVTGENFRTNTIEEAIALKQQLVDAWLQSKVPEANGIHSITTISIDNYGNELWSGISYDSLHKE